MERATKYGGNITYTKYTDIERDFIEKKVHPIDLKNATSVYINKVVEPVRSYFEDKEPSSS